MTEKTCPTCHRPLPADAPLCPVCALLGAKEEAAPAGIPPLEKIQAAFPDLEVLECIGRGGMGIVYKARQPHLDRLVALKILAPELSADPGFAERFSREAVTLAKLSHPHIVGIHDYGQRGEFCYLLMEYVDGVNLRQAMRAARFTPEQALALVPDLCSALQFAHDHRILHRDIKPENILIDTRGRVRIADFGIAQLLSEGPSHVTLTATGSALGSAAYMAPEQIEGGGEIDHRADIYSLGVVLYEMLTGGLPLGRFPLPSEKSSATTGIDEVVLRALEKERERRYQQADEVRTGIDHAATRPGAKRPAAVRPDDDFLRRITTWSLGLLGGGLITGIVGVITSPVIFGVGLIACIFGLLGCWWLLIGMRTGRFQPALRMLLLGVAFFPVLGGLLWSISVVPLLRGFTDVIYSRQPMPLLWVIIPFAVAVIGGRLLWKLVALPGSGDPSSRFRRMAPVAGTIALLLSLLAAKHLNVTLKLLRQHVGLEYQIFQSRPFRPLNDEDAALVKDAARKAAGEDEGFYRVEFLPTFQSIAPDRSPTPTGAMGVEFVVSHPRDAKEYSDAFDQRLRALIPARIEINNRGGGFRFREIQNAERTTRCIFAGALVIFLGTASLLLIFSGKRAFIVSLVTGAVACAVVSAVTTWPTPAFLPPSLGERPPLPELPLHDEDFGTPEASVDSLLKAAAVGNQPTFLKGFSAMALDARRQAQLLELMPFFAACTRTEPTEIDDSGTGAKVDLTFWRHNKAPKSNYRESFHLNLRAEEGAWRIAGELPGLIRFLQDRTATPYFKSE